MSKVREKKNEDYRMVWDRIAECYRAIISIDLPNIDRNDLDKSFY